MSENNSSANADSFDGTMVMVAAGFENAVTDYEHSWLTFESCKEQLDRAHFRVDIARGKLEEATLSADEIASEFNSTQLTDEDYDDLIRLLDISRDHMLTASDEYDAANARLLEADEQYESSRSNIDNALSIACTLRTELDYTASNFAETGAANDDQFITTEALDLLSDSAKYFYRYAA